MLILKGSIVPLFRGSGGTKEALEEIGFGDERRIKELFDRT